MFKPNYTLSQKLVKALMKIEANRESVSHLPITPVVLSSLKKTARLQSIHYSTAIEGNRLTQEEVREVLDHHGHFPGRERDEKEILGYYTALNYIETIAQHTNDLSQTHIKMIHALVMAGGSDKAKPSPYRLHQNVIREGSSGGIAYMPPEPQDVAELMRELVDWISANKKEDMPIPVIAAIAHYQFVTIHPYMDGNGRTARLLTTLILHQGGYDLKGIYCLEEYYATQLTDYYQALTIGPSHNYYFGRAEADITEWIEYFCSGMVHSFDAVKKQAEQAIKRKSEDASPLLRKLDARQRKVIDLFLHQEAITSNDIASIFGIAQRSARQLATSWVEENFLVILDPAKKSRKYGLAKQWKEALKL